MIDLKNLTIASAHESLKKGEYTCRELAEEYLKNIKEKDASIHAYLEVYDDVLVQADNAQKMFDEGHATLLTGIPVAVKDIILIEGKISSSASKILENYVASYDSTVIQKLKIQGAVFLGRTNMDEFALGSSTENSAFGATKNPHDLERVPGGTSGGSAAAVAGEMALVSLGTDTGGSVRFPSAFCGVVGLKPTYGKVSRHGVIAAVSSFDQVGPITRTIEDAEILFKAIQGSDPLDSTTINDQTYPKHQLKLNPKGKMSIGVPWNLIDTEGIDQDVKNNFKASVKCFEDAGYTIQDIKLPDCLSVYYIINFAEVSSNLARFDGLRYGTHKDGKDLFADYMLSRGSGFGLETRRRILLGTYVLSAGYYDAYYGKAQTARTYLRKEFAKIFSEVDVILTPTSPILPWKRGEKSDPLSMYLADIFTVSANLVGIPGISIPSGSVNVDGKDLPLGIQFMASHDQEDTLFTIGKDFEKLV
jgi:aspartyl-tRNA(Asn)/glutamyl-tRNA(Gln) amidotransferase subunit A